MNNTTTGITENERRTGVLVIGGGGVVCRAAVAAHDAGANVLMVLKGSLGTSLELDSLPYFVRCGPEGPEIRPATYR